VVEVAWAAATYFVVPVLVVDGVGPIEAAKRSAAILKRTWGETVGGVGGLGAISFLFFLPVVLLFFLIGTSRLEAWASPVVAISLIAIVVVYVLVLTVVFTALGTIFRTGAYIYATTGQAPSSMDPALLQGAVRKK